MIWNKPETISIKWKPTTESIPPCVTKGREQLYCSERLFCRHVCRAPGWRKRCSIRQQSTCLSLRPTLRVWKNWIISSFPVAPNFERSLSGWYGLHPIPPHRIPPWATQVVLHHLSPRIRRLPLSRQHPGAPLLHRHLPIIFNKPNMGKTVCTKHGKLWPIVSWLDNKRPIAATALCKN